MLSHKIKRSLKTQFQASSDWTINANVGCIIHSYFIWAIEYPFFTFSCPPCSLFSLFLQLSDFYFFVHDSKIFLSQLPVYGYRNLKHHFSIFTYTSLFTWFLHKSLYRIDVWKVYGNCHQVVKISNSEFFRQKVTILINI